jgi:hypothetical protein
VEKWQMDGDFDTEITKRLIIAGVIAIVIFFVRDTERNLPKTFCYKRRGNGVKKPKDSQLVPYHCRYLPVSATLFLLLLQGIQQETTTTQQSFAQINGNIINLSNISPLAGDSRVAVSGNNVYVVWTETISYGGPSVTTGRNSDILFSRSTDNGASFSSPVALTNYKTGLKQEPRIAVSGTNLYIIWSDYSTGAAQILFTRSVNNGSSFSNPVTMGTSFGAAGETQLHAYKNDVYVLWIGSSNQVNAGAVLLKSSSDNGTTFGNTISLSHNGIASKPQMTVAGNYVYVVWYNSTLQTRGIVTDDQILFSRSADSGVNFSTPINISKNPNSFSARPQIASSGRNVYVTWFESAADHSLNIANTYFSRSTDFGMTFGTPLQLSNNGPANNYYYFTSDTPQIAVSNTRNDPDSIYIIWTYPSLSASSSPQNTDVFFSRSTDAGITFSSPPFNISNNPGLSGDAGMIVSTNASNHSNNTGSTDSISVVWLDDSGSTPGKYSVLFSGSGDSGASFSNPVNISGNQGASLSPKMVISGNNAYITWTEFNSGYYAILFRVVPLQ